MNNALLATMLFLILYSFSSCIKDNPSGEHIVLRASLQETPVSIFDIFEKVEIIPLETSECSFLTSIHKMVFHDERIYVFDWELYTLFIFDNQGKYIDKIHKIGRGPGEYIMAYDFLVDTKEKTLELLNPMGFIHKYDYEGNFVSMAELPNPPPNYQNFEKIDDVYVTWSSVRSEDEMGVNLIDGQTYEVKKGFFPNNGLWSGFSGSSVFNNYNGDTFYHESMANKVYRITFDGYETVYEWDLGVQSIDPQRLTGTVTNDAKMAILDDVRKGKIPFFRIKQLQSKDYYFASLNFQLEQRIWKSLFYHKATGKSVFFHRTTEGIDPIFQLMNDEYAIGLIIDNDTEGLQKVVSAEDAELLRNRKEDDNWWLVKYTFR